MKLAVIMAVHNNQDTLNQAVTSILKQTFKKFEFIIINDASTDHSLEVLKTFKDKRIKIINNQKQLGLTKSLNKGLKQTKAQYIARMDADDISLPTRFSKQLAFFQKHPDTVLLGTAAFLINSQGKQVGLKRHPKDHAHIKTKALHTCPFIHPTWMLKRFILNQIGDYDQKFPFAQDYDLALRIISKYKTANLDQPLIKYRVNFASAISFKNLKKQELLALKARLLALTKYGYPITDLWKLVKPLLSFLIPAKLKTKIYQKFYWQ
ncbi:glycosyltransferase [Patescibacteria group bacterium]